VAVHDYVISNGTGAAVRSDLNGALAAIVSQNSSATEPSPTYAYQRWADTTAGVMKMRNGANSAWITLYQLDGEWSTIAFENGSAAAPSIYFKDSGTDTGIYSPGADQVAISTGGTGRLFVTSAGLVGVGTAAPGSRLSVEAVSSDTTPLLTSLGSANGSESAIFLRGGSTSGFYYDFKRSGTTGSLEIQGNQASFNNICLAPTSGNVGIGTTSPSNKLHLSTAGTSYLQIENTTASNNFYVGNSAGSGVFELTGSNQFKFISNSSDRVVIDSSGRLLVGVSANANGGILQLSSGITFPATAVAASDVNTLDDYEEGSWTPTFAPSSGSFTTMTVNIQGARYVKIGQQVTVSAYFFTTAVNATGASGDVSISGLPFATRSTQNVRYGAVLGYTAGFNSKPISAYIDDNSTAIQLLESTTDNDFLDVADLNTTAGNKNFIYVTATYFVN
jgi:hypothetical protein